MFSFTQSHWLSLCKIDNLASFPSPPTPTQPLQMFSKFYVLIISLWGKCHVELAICPVVSTYEKAALYSPIVPSGHLLLLSGVCALACTGAGSQNWLSGCQRRRGCWWGQAARQVVPRVHVLCDGWVGVSYSGSLHWCLQKKRCRLPCFVHLRFPPFRSCDHANRAATVISRCTDVLVTEESEKRGPYISYLSQHSLGPAIASDV